MWRGPAGLAEQAGLVPPDVAASLREAAVPGELDAVAAQARACGPGSAASSRPTRAGSSRPPTCRASPRSIRCWARRIVGRSWRRATRWSPARCGAGDRRMPCCCRSLRRWRHWCARTTSHGSRPARVTDARWRSSTGPAAMRGGGAAWRCAATGQSRRPTEREGQADRPRPLKTSHRRSGGPVTPQRPVKAWRTTAAPSACRQSPCQSPITRLAVPDPCERRPFSGPIEETGPPSHPVRRFGATIPPCLARSPRHPVNQPVGISGSDQRTGRCRSHSERTRSRSMQSFHAQRPARCPPPIGFGQIGCVRHRKSDPALAREPGELSSVPPDRPSSTVQKQVMQFIGDTQMAPPRRALIDAARDFVRAMGESSEQVSVSRAGSPPSWLKYQRPWNGVAGPSAVRSRARCEGSAHRQLPRQRSAGFMPPPADPPSPPP